MIFAGMSINQHLLDALVATIGSLEKGSLEKGALEKGWPEKKHLN